MLPPGSVVCLHSGYTSAPRLGKVRHFQENEDAYSVDLDRGDVVSASILDMHIQDAGHFGKLQVRVAKELRCFEDHHLGTRETMHPKEEPLGPFRKALTKTTSTMQLCSATDSVAARLLLFQDGSSRPHAQLLPYTTVCDPAAPTFMLGEADGLSPVQMSEEHVCADSFMVVCGTHTFCFRNEYPCFHLPLERMLSLTSEKYAPWVKINERFANMFESTKNEVKDYCPVAGVLVFETDDDICWLASFQLGPNGLVMARILTPTKYKLRLLGCMHDTLGVDEPVYGPPPKLEDGFVQQGTERIVRGINEVRTLTGEVVPPEMFSDPAIFLTLQAVLAGRFLCYTNEHAKSTGGMVAAYTKMLAAMEKHIAEHLPEVVLPFRVETATLDEEYMGHVASSERVLLAWMANVESLDYALRIIERAPSDSVRWLQMDGTRMCVVYDNNGHATHVANFSMHPLKMQQYIFCRILGDALQTRPPKDLREIENIAMQLAEDVTLEARVSSQARVKLAVQAQDLKREETEKLAVQKRSEDAKLKAALEKRAEENAQDLLREEAMEKLAEEIEERTKIEKRAKKSAKKKRKKEAKAEAEAAKRAEEVEEKDKEKKKPSAKVDKELSANVSEVEGKEEEKEEKVEEEVEEKAEQTEMADVGEAEEAETRGIEAEVQEKARVVSYGELSECTRAGHVAEKALLADLDGADAELHAAREEIVALRASLVRLGAGLEEQRSRAAQAEVRAKAAEAEISEARAEAADAEASRFRQTNIDAAFEKLEKQFAYFLSQPNMCIGGAVNTDLVCNNPTTIAVLEWVAVAHGKALAKEELLSEFAEWTNKYAVDLCGKRLKAVES